MNKISYPQLVKDIADAYRNAIGSTDPITIGELANKVGEAISNGGGDSIHYKSITYNEDNTITLIDNDDIEHIMVCIYEDEKITSITLGDEEIKLNYDGDKLITVEDTEINLGSILGSGSTDDGEDGGSSINLFSDLQFETTGALNVVDYGDYYYCEFPKKTSSGSIAKTQRSLGVSIESEVNYLFSFDISSYSVFNSDAYILIESSYHSEKIYLTGDGSYSFELPSSPIPDTVYITLSMYGRTQQYYNLHNLSLTPVNSSGNESSSMDNINVTKTKDFQNGFIVGLTSKGKATQKSISVENSVEVIQSAYINTEINTSSNVSVETTAILESEE
jgi:hypothetical protein